MNNQSASYQHDTALIRVSRLTKNYENGAGVIRVLADVNFCVYPREMVAIMGPSGSGKSTLLAILGLFLSPSEGVYNALNQNVLTLSRSAQAAFRRQFVGFVFQSCNLIEHSSVYENLEYPLIYSGLRRSERPARILEALDRVNLSHRLHHPANLLSGGEQQRVAVARALVNRPKIILADEPTGQLDGKNGHLVIDYFKHFVEDGDTAIALVTHDPEVAKRCHRTCCLKDGVMVSRDDRGSAQAVH